MTLKYKTVFFAPADDQNGIADMMGMDEPDLDPQTGEIIEEPLTDEPKSDEPKGDAPVTVPPADQTKALADAFAASLKQAFPQGQPQVQVSQQPKLSPEEAKKLLKYPTVTKEWIAKFGNLETQEQAMQEFVQQVSEHAYTLAEARARDLEEKLTSQFQPIAAKIQAQEDEARWDKFGKKYPALSRPELRPMLTTVLQSIAATGYRPTSEDDIFDKLAQGALPVIQQINPQFNLAAQAVRPQQNNGRGSTIPTVTPGGGGANGGGTGNVTTKTSVIKSFFK